MGLFDILKSNPIPDPSADLKREWAAFRKTHGDRSRHPAPGETAVNFPQTEEDFEPPLFFPTERNRRRNPLDMLAIKALYLTLYRTLRMMGYKVNEYHNAEAHVVFSWSEKRKYESVAPERKVFLELGWLPRSSYQISPDGVNARSHVAREYRYRPLDPADRERVLAFLERMRKGFARSVDPARVQAIREEAGGPFILFAFQLATDYNLKFSNSGFQRFYTREPAGNIRFAQACVEYVEAKRLPLPVMFKQHPSDHSDLAGGVTLSRPENRLWTNERGYSTHDIFASGMCRLVISVNSNTIHEAACWGIPSICLGTLLWPPDLEERPVPRDPEAAEEVMAAPLSENGRLLSYLFHIVRNQWTLNDFQNPYLVEKLVETRGRCEPYALRREAGFELL